MPVIGIVEIADIGIKEKIMSELDQVLVNDLNKSIAELNSILVRASQLGVEVSIGQVSVATIGCEVDNLLVIYTAKKLLHV